MVARALSAQRLLLIPAVSATPAEASNAPGSPPRLSPSQDTVALYMRFSCVVVRPGSMRVLSELTPPWWNCYGELTSGTPAAAAQRRDSVQTMSATMVRRDAASQPRRGMCAVLHWSCGAYERPVRASPHPSQPSSPAVYTAQHACRCHTQPCGTASITRTASWPTPLQRACERAVQRSCA